MTPYAIDRLATDELLRRYRDGDQQALTELLEMYRDYLRVVLGLRMDPALAARLDVSDVIQEANLEAVRRLDDFLEREPMPFHVWLRETALQCLLQQRRKHVETKGRTVSRDVPLPERSSVLLAGLVMGATPSEQVAEQELAERVRAALGRLSEDDREILLMRNFEGLTNQEAALALAIAPDASRKRYTRALARLRDVLLDEGLSESQL